MGQKYPNVSKVSNNLAVYRLPQGLIINLGTHWTSKGCQNDHNGHEFRDNNGQEPYNEIRLNTLGGASFLGLMKVGALFK